MTHKAPTQASILFATLVACFVSLSAHAVVLPKPAAAAPDILAACSEMESSAEKVGEAFCRDCCKSSYSSGNFASSPKILPVGQALPLSKQPAAASAGKVE